MVNIKDKKDLYFIEKGIGQPIGELGRMEKPEVFNTSVLEFLSKHS